MFRLLLLSLLLFWSVVQVFIGLEVPSSKRIHYTMMNNYGLQALSMNQRKISIGGYGNSGYAYGPLGSSQSASDVYIDSDILLSPQSLQTSKNTPVFTADSLEAISEQNLTLISEQSSQEIISDIKKPNVLADKDTENVTVVVPELMDQVEDAVEPIVLEADTLEPDIVEDANISDVSIITDSTETDAISTDSINTDLINTKKDMLQTSLKEADFKETESFDFGIQVDSLIDQLEAVQEDVNSELIESEVKAKAHSNIALRVPLVPEEIAVIQETDSEVVALSPEKQERKLIFEAQSGPAVVGAMGSMGVMGAVGGLAQTEKQVGQSVMQQRSFKVALTSLPARAEVRSNQSIADNLTQTSTTVVSGLEITLNPNEAVRREVPVEQQAFLWPLPTKGRLTSGYGNRTLAITNNHFHRGIDIAVKTGTPILAVKDGVVEKAGWDGGYGYAVYLRHNDGTESRYAHMSRIIAEEGEWVNQGQWLGLVGSTGLSTGPHLHFELHLGGNAVDPSKHLVFSGERFATR